ncbi:MAG TPA: hypothetical protein VGN35_00380 [Jatrophihabitantaceae bacterium]|jgi:hypothetical protein|nr:hypothetical protein [Jatrophihabitantaceae bacterium]
MRLLRRVLQEVGLQHKEGRIPLINPEVPRRQLWMFIGFYAVFGIILVILHHTIAPWI